LAAERFRAFATVELQEHQRYDEKRVNCGEAINEVGLVPRPKTLECGCHTRVEGFDVEIYPSTGREPDAAPLATPRIGMKNGYITDQDTLERQWARRAREADHVTVHEGVNVTPDRYREAAEQYDYLVDARGNCL
jgi:digeranylgeranylglycerophospholipid reductase